MREFFFLGSWAKSPRIRQSGNQLFLSSDSKYTRREPLTERLSLHIRACARVLYYCLSACHKSNSRRNFGGLSAKIIKHDHVVLNAQRVEQVKHSLGHHRRTAQVVLDVLWSVVLLEVGVAHHWSNEAWSVLHTMNASALVSGRSLLEKKLGKSRETMMV